MADDGLRDVEVLDVFVVGDDGELATAAWWERPAPAPARSPTATDDVPAALPQPATTPPAAGSGSAPAATPSVVRTVGEYDVWRAVVVEPSFATARCLDGSAFRDIAGLSMDPEPVRVEGQTSVWNVRIRVGAGRSRAAELLVHPSPSWVLTVVELRPRSIRRGRRRFIRAGLGVVDRLSERLVGLDASAPG
ncbi:MAG: hypothetical protein AAF081_07470 [Actinomycetota bacterium]